MSVLPPESAEAMCGALYEIDDVERKVSLVDTALLGLLPRENVVKAVEPIHPAIERIRRVGGWLSINDLLTWFTMSDRQARRLFRDVTGLTARRFARILRFNDAFNKLWELENATALFEAISMESGSEYTDQPHFFNEFTALTGYSPTALPRERFETSRLLNEVPG